MMKIAIVRLSALGDIFQSMIVLQFIKKKFPNAQIDWIVDKSFQDALEDNPHINRVIAIPIKQIKKTKSLNELFLSIRKLRQLTPYDYVFDLQGLIKSSLVARLITSRNRIGFDKKSIREKLASFFYTKSYFVPYEENVIRRYCSLINQSLGLNIVDRDILNKKPFFDINKISDKKNLIVLILGASFNAKIYPEESFLSIVRLIDENFLAIWNTKSEKFTAKRLLKNSTNVKILQSSSLSDLKRIISSASIVIGGDTGPTHLAWAMNIPSVTIFGCTPMERNFFKTEINLALKSPSSVNPMNINKKDFTIREVDPMEVIECVNKLL